MRILRQGDYPKISVNRVYRLMRQLNIKSIVIKEFRNYRQRMQILHISNTIRNGWTYLASILDVCTRKIVGFSYSRKMDKSLVISDVQNACLNQEYPKNAILHSDRGSQYASNDYINLANRLGMSLSYSKKGCPFDNAPMESFHASLKKEEVYLKHYSAINYMTPIAFESKLLSC